MTSRPESQPHSIREMRELAERRVRELETECRRLQAETATAVRDYEQALALLHAIDTAPTEEPSPADAGARAPRERRAARRPPAAQRSAPTRRDDAESAAEREHRELARQVLAVLVAHPGLTGLQVAEQLGGSPVARGRDVFRVLVQLRAEGTLVRGTHKRWYVAGAPPA